MHLLSMILSSPILYVLIVFNQIPYLHLWGGKQDGRQDISQTSEAIPNSISSELKSRFPRWHEPWNLTSIEQCPSEVPGSARPYAIERELSRLGIDRKMLRDRRIIVIEYTSGYRKDEIWEYGWISNDTRQATEGTPYASPERISLSRHFAGQYLESILYRAITSMTSWRHAHIVILEDHPCGFIGKVYGYSDGENKIGEMHEDGKNWSYSYFGCQYYVYGFTNMAFSEIFDAADKIISKWKAQGILYDLLNNNCEHFTIKLARALYIGNDDSYNQSESNKRNYSVDSPETLRGFYENRLHNYDAPMTSLSGGAFQGLAVISIALFCFVLAILLQCYGFIWMCYRDTRRLLQWRAHQGSKTHFQLPAQPVQKKKSE